MYTSLQGNVCGDILKLATVVKVGKLLITDKLLLTCYVHRKDITLLNWESKLETSLNKLQLCTVTILQNLATRLLPSEF